MRLIPVLDVLHGEVVRGAGGRRHEYQPIVSRLTTSTDPVEMARTLMDRFQPRELYLADLDALGGEARNLELYRRIGGAGVRLWVDAGIAGVAGARAVADTGCDVVAGLETVPDPQTLAEIVNALGPDRVVFSLDLKDGEPLRRWPGSESPPAVVAMAVACGVTRVIVLDLARVGGGGGTGTDDLCRELAWTYPDVEIIAGGGVSSRDDLHRLERCGVQGALVASALHDGRIGPESTR